MPQSSLQESGSVPNVIISSGTDTIALLISEDFYLGNAQFTVSVDGLQIGGTQIASALEAQGDSQIFDIEGNFGPGTHTVTVDFLNDAYAGTPSTDRNLYVLGASYDGVAAPSSSLAIMSSMSQSITVGDPVPGPTVIGAGSDTIALGVDEDAWLGNAEFTVSVDGVQVGGVQTVTAISSAGESQVFDVEGDFGAGTHTVTINFLNAADAPGYSQEERSLYVLSASYDDVADDAGTLTLTSDGPATFAVEQSVPARTVIGSGADTIALLISEDFYLGNAQFTVSVDGLQIGGTQIASALEAQGDSQIFDIEGNFGPGTHTVTVDFLNDAYAGTPSTDRNLYVLGASYDGVAAPSSSLAIMSSMSQSITVGDPVPGPTVIGAGSDTIALGVDEDAWLGNAEFTVSVDGVQVGGVQTVTAISSAGESQVFDVEGDFGAGTHTVTINFLNAADAPGYSQEERSLYALSVSYDGFVSPSSTLTITSPTTYVVTVGTSAASPGFQLVGVNLSGAEYGSPTPSNPGVEGTDYVLPTEAELQYYASEGLNLIRLPFLWERMQPAQNGPLNETYLSQIGATVAAANALGMKVDLDLHNYGYGYGYEIGSVETPNSSLDNLWSQIAAQFAGNSNVLFGIMNEPYSQTASQWATAEESAVLAIRAAGATTQEILASGTGWDSGTNWISSGNAAVLASTVIDPDHNLAFEVHQYLDPSYAGTSSVVASPTTGIQQLSAVTKWAQAQGVRLFLGEIGVASDPASLTALSNTLNYMEQNTNAWQGAAYWAGGQWWGSYAFSVEPENGMSKPQMTVLSQYVSHSN